MGRVIERVGDVICEGRVGEERSEWREIKKNFMERQEQ
jgi:hypothetical protein